ncbi:uncharacterized protein BDZ83DRAFT_649475 [Colletotrichum acutatum]|uniref:Uncharacterized protein n=1 Tax=Glomerella acutata TaxID=27357 RepID=A0AAD8UPJ0_GLOAC|nr:uncharacterized protein BDZ83DRAFT_649475 [Colletotrichum acutatum]KAK1727611.1 hypothetical protein BDZ83DRAFT_649475 [Colletotrichum acutatum]
MEARVISAILEPESCAWCTALVWLEVLVKRPVNEVEGKGGNWGLVPFSLLQRISRGLENRETLNDGFPETQATWCREQGITHASAELKTKLRLSKAEVGLWSLDKEASILDTVRMEGLELASESRLLLLSDNGDGDGDGEGGRTTVARPQPEVAAGKRSCLPCRPRLIGPDRHPVAPAQVCTSLSPVYHCGTSPSMKQAPSTLVCSYHLPAQHNLIEYTSGRTPVS